MEVGVNILRFTLSILLMSAFCRAQQLGCETTPCFHGATCHSQPLEPYYRCSCTSGFSGSTCQEDVDECLFDSPCRNGGLCVNIFGGYECHCGPSWEGRQCENLVKQCAAFPCSNGATCTDVGEDYFCTCDTGYRGDHCEEDINECLEQSPCLNGASCTNNNGSYTCDCVLGFAGVNCEENIDECQLHTPCLNGATCKDLVNGYACLCAPGYAGLLCDTRTHECGGSPCLYGECNNTGQGEVVCSCSEGYMGSHCDTDIQECDSSPCIHGDCVDRLAGYTCYCREGYEGDNCQIDVDECLSSPCTSASTCVNSDNRFICQCVDGYAGVDCSEDIDECSLYQPCQNGASCTDDVNSYSCMCVTGYEGVNCTVNTDDCETNSCINGECIDRLAGVDCNCLPGWAGPLCDRDVNECGSSPCVNGAMCVDDVNSYNCTCADGYTGTLCQVDVDDCAAIDCHNGTCADGVDKYTCVCDLGYAGSHCEEEIDECTDLSPCLNGATCVDLVNNYTCQCLAGYEGFHCELIVNPCIEKPCQNGARCEHAKGNYQCVCLEGWTGMDCEIEVNECDVFSPCYNNATCEDLIAGYGCHCTPGYNGSQCEIDVNECISSPCHHLATCIDLVNTYRCICSTGFTGDQCDVDVDECSPSPCVNNGTCTQTIPGEYNCECAVDISGSTCDLVNSVYLNPGGYLELPYTAADADVITILFSYKTYVMDGIVFWTSAATPADEHPRLLLVELTAGSIRVILDTGSGRAVLTQRTAGRRIQLIIGNDGVALSQPPSVFTEDSYVAGTAQFIQSLTGLYLGSPDQWTPFLRANVQSGDNYHGCVGNLTVNRQGVDLDEALTLRGGHIGCEQTSTCPADYCHNNGTCTETWGETPHCTCQTGYAGDRCQILRSVEFLSSQMLHISSPSFAQIPDIALTLSLHNLTQNAVLLYTINGNRVSLVTNRAGEITMRLLGIGYSLSCSLPIPHAIVEVQLQFTDYTMYLRLRGPDTGEAATVCSESSTSLIEVKGPLYFGFIHPNPVMDVWRDVIGYSEGLTGCVSNLMVSTEPISFATSTPTGLSLDPPLPSAGCRRGDICEVSTPCDNGATCRGLWDRYDCLCRSMYTGKECSDGVSTTFNGHTSAVTIEVDPTTHPVVLQGALSLRTTSIDTVLLHATYSPSTSVRMSVNENGQAQLQIRTDKSGEFIIRSDVSVNSGEWVELSWSIDRVVTLSVSGQGSSAAEWRDYEYLQTNHTVYIVIGAQLFSSDTMLLINHYKGCLSSLVFYPALLTSDLLDISVPSEDDGVIISTHSVQHGCHGDDVCTNNACPINSDCVDLWNEYQCDCKPGWQGVDCNTSTDDCIGVDCKHGSCIDGHLNYSCGCDSGYAGVDCSIELSACDWLPCTVNQTSECIATPPLQYSCVCLPGYHGNTCDLDINDCDSTPCQNGGSCVDLVNSYSCLCVDGWAGINCHINIDDCETSSCASNSQCIDQVDGYTCVCAPGLTGGNCTLDIEECADQPCKFDSVCVEPKPDTYSCVCPDHLSGTHCEQVSAVTLTGSAHLQLPPLSTSPDDVIIIEFSFSTTITSALLYLAVNEELYQGVVVELLDSKLRLHLYTGYDVATFLLPLTARQDNVITQQVQLRLLLKSDKLQISLPPATQFYEMEVKDLNRLHLNSSVYVGGVPFYTPFITSLVSSRDAFVGCFSNYVINGEPISLLHTSTTGSDIELGCKQSPLCNSSSCSSHGKCRDYWTHTQCTCDVGYTGESCDNLTTVEFSSNNLLHLPTDSELTEIKLQFSVNPSSIKSGVILYTLPVSSSALVVYVNSSSVWVVSLSVGQSTVTSVHNSNIHLGLWCSLQLQLGALSQSLTVSCGDMTASSSESYSQEVEFFGPLYFGVIYSTSSAHIWRERLTAFTHSLSACLRDVVINGEYMNLAEATPTAFLSDPPPPLPGCSRDLQCDIEPNVCSQHGECVSSWGDSHPVCRCADGFDGDLCTQARPLTFDGIRSRGTFTVDMSQISVGWSGSFLFRTRATSGTILYMASANYHRELLLDSSGRLEVQTSSQQPTVDAASQSSLADGAWHQVSWTSHPLRFLLNDTDLLEFSGEEIKWFTDTELKVHVGSKRLYSASASTDHWKGCIASLTLNQQLFVASSPPAGVSYSGRRVTAGCHGDKQCLSANICPQNAVCVDEWNTHQCVCMEGWQGVDCSRSVNDCVSHRCVNGECIDKHIDYKCQCHRGYEGPTCDVVTLLCGSRDLCHSVNTLSCIDVFPLNYTCQCKSGWTGTRCTEEVNECSSSPCRHNAECVDQVNGFSCVCDEDHFGGLCEQTHVCSSSPCNNGATCVPSGDNSLYLCKCTEQYLGERCDVYNSCYKNECQHGSTCLSDSLNRVYSCSCTPGYYGNKCGSVDYCHDNRCQNEAECINLSNKYSCICVDDYIGEFCSTVRDKCLNHTCQHGASCFFDSAKPQSDYRCLCAAGYLGDSCEVEVDECLPSPCHRGSCTDQVAKYRCTCELGWQGANCDVNINECNSNPCLHAGTCIDEVNGYTCVCSVGYEGLLCDLDFRGCRSSPCLNNATCVSARGDNFYTCKCPGGFDGTLCGTNIDDCRHNLCLFGSTCVDLIQGYRCDCLPGYSGEHCTERLDSCYTSPCRNGAVCSYAGLCSCADVNQLCGFHDESCQRIRCEALEGCYLKDVSYTCDCSGTTFTGSQCDIDINECGTGAHTCRHPSRCIDKVGGFSCDCANTGYQGDNCQIDIDECSGAIGATRCRNGGTCINHSGYYICICLDGWDGEDCSSDIKECSSNPCAHNSTCIEGVNGYICVCTAGYAGAYCNLNIDECNGEAAVCVEGATCVDTVGGYHCVCPEQQAGELCEVSLRTTSSVRESSPTSSTIGAPATSQHSQSTAERKPQIALIASLSVLMILLLCAAIGFILYRYECITPLTMKGSYRPGSVSNLPMTVQYSNDNKQMLI